MSRLIHVALPVRLFRPLTYAVEGTWAESVRPGSRVIVPLRSGRAVGVVTALDVEGNGRVIKRVLDVPNEPAALPGPLLETCEWIARYYAAPIGLVLRAALPALLASSGRIPTRRGVKVVTIAQELPSLAERDRVFARAPKQRALYEMLESLGGSAALPLLRERGHGSASVLAALSDRGVVRVTTEERAGDPFGVTGAPTAPALQPTPAQRAAIESILASREGDVTLLRGVTGSGKTLVYMEALRAVLRAGKTAIVLVPEIALTPQTVGRFRAVFGDDVAVLHSALGERERMEAWRALRAGRKRIAVGARSAIFAPLERVGAIVVDEEHEATYKQEETPRYHARDVAIVRARHEGAFVVLGSATPSLESWTNATSRRYKLLALRQRVGGGALPAVRVVDLRKDRTKPTGESRESQEPRAPQRRDPFRLAISEELENALQDRLTRREQSLLLLNRRGYSAFVQCSACGDVVTCPRCSITLTYHRSPETMVCHYCAYRTARRESCERCGQRTLRRRGLGTQQLEEMIAERFPTCRIARMDVDTTGGRLAHATILDRVGRGEADVLLGTQMIAKGLDFPNVTLVGVVDADVGINLPDFRASERTFQLLSQVAGRAGRGPKGGEVIIQTRNPAHHAVRCAVAHDFEAFVAEELPGRQTPAYPPVVRLTRIVLSATDEVVAADLAIAAVDWLKRLAESKQLGTIGFMGPAPCPIERIKKRWRWHVVIKASDTSELSRLLTYFAQRFPIPSKAQARASIDRDPVTLL